MIRDICIRASKQSRLQSTTTNNCSTHSCSFVFVLYCCNVKTLHCAPFAIVVVFAWDGIVTPTLGRGGSKPSTQTIQICLSADYSLTRSHKHWTQCEYYLTWQDYILNSWMLRPITVTAYLSVGMYIQWCILALCFLPEPRPMIMMRIQKGREKHTTMIDGYETLTIPPRPNAIENSQNDSVETIIVVLYSSASALASSQFCSIVAPPSSLPLKNCWNNEYDIL